MVPQLSSDVAKSFDAAKSHRCGWFALSLVASSPKLRHRERHPLPNVVRGSFLFSFFFSLFLFVLWLMEVLVVVCDVGRMVRYGGSGGGGSVALDLVVVTARCSGESVGVLC